MMRALDEGRSVAITPDGPRGPARIAARGAVALARLSGRPILPLSWSASSCWRAGGWDRMMIPKPFSRGRLVMGPLIHVSGHAPGHVSGHVSGKGWDSAGRDSAGRDTLEQYRRRLEASLNELGVRADALHAADNPPAEARPDAAPDTAARHLPH